MNRTYRSVWNEAAGTYVAAAENTRAQGKKSSRCALNIASAAIASAVTFGSYGAAWAADPGLTPKPTSSAANLSTPTPSSEWFCFLFWCGGGGGSTTNITYNGVNAQDAYAYTYDRNNLKYFHVQSSLSDSSATGGDAIAIGGGAQANGVSKNGTTYGWPGSTTGNGPIAIGGAALAQGAANVAVGVDAVADGLYHAVAVGGDADAADVYTVALGGHSLAAASTSTALGSHASALAAGSVALGEGSVATRSNTVSVGKQGGERQITNVAAGSAGTDAVNVDQLNAAIAAGGSGGGGGGSGGGGGNTINLPPDLKYFHASSTLADASAAGQETVAVGGNATALAANSVALGSNSVADRANTVSVGNDLTNRQITHLAAGTADTDAVNVGQLNTTVQNAITGGALPNLVVYDSAAHNALTLGGVGATQPVRLMNVAPGAITQNSTDAINGSQMFQLAQATQQGFNDVGNGMNALAQSTATALGGNSSANTPDGSITPPSYKIGDQTYHNVGEALDALAANGGGGGGGSANSVNYDTAAHNVVTLGGTLAHAPVALTNVANGAINANSTDAINGKQMYATTSTVANAIGAGASVKADGTLAAPSYVISGVTYNDMGSAINAIGAVGQDVQITAKYVKVSSTASQALSNGVETTAIGGAAYASGDRSVAIGTGARAQYDDSVALGSNAQVYESNTVSVGRKGGEKRVTNVADGVSATDAATVGQLTALQKALSTTSPMVHSMLLTDTSVLDYIKVSPNVMTGAPTSVSNDLNAMAIGPSANASGTNALAVGAGAGAARTGSTAVGSGAAALAVNSTVIGQGASTGFNALNGVSIGYMADAENANSLGFGSFSIAGGTGSVALGYNALVFNAATNAMALGTGATATTAGSIALGTGSIADRANTISVGNASTQRQIVNVAAGTANTDAVNVSQLKGVTSTLGGGATVAGDGSVTKPSYVIGGTTYNDVGSALDAAAGSGSTDAVKYDTAAHNRVTLGGTSATSPVKLTNVAAGSANSDAVNVKQLKDLGATVDTNGNVTNGFVAYDDATNANVTLKGASGTKIKNVAAGTLSAASMDAVNGSQLYQTNQNVANVSANVSNINTIVNNIAAGGGIKYFHANSTLADSQAGGADSVAIGGNAQATTTGSVALGSNARVTANNAVAIGYNAVADRANTVSVGANGAERQIVNVAAGSTNTDAVNLKQLKDLGATVDPNGNVTNGFVAYDDATKSKVTLGGVAATTPVKVANVAAGSANNDAVNVKQLKDLGATVDTSGNVTNGFVAYDDASKNTVTLRGASGTKITNVAPGAITSASKDAVNGSQLYQTNQNVANIGASVNNVTNYYNTLVEGGGIKYFHANSTLGDSLANADDAIAIGGNAQASASDSIALGANTHATAANAVALGSGSVADRANTISVGASGAERQVVNVAAGTANTDAVNVSQLKGITTVLGGGADVAADGSIKKPQYVINGTTYNDVGLAIDAAAQTGGTAVDAVRYDTSAHNKVTLGGISATSPVKLTNVAAGSANSDAVNVKQLKDLGANVDTNGNVTNGFVAYDDSTGASVTLKGASGTKIKNVMAGVLSESSMEAVNGSQLYQTNQNVANLAGNVNNMSDTLNNLNDGGGLKYFHANSALADSQAGGANSVAIGGNAQATTTDSVALGSNARTTAANAVALGSGSLADRANSVSVGAGGAERQIVNVAAGSQNTDAVNLKQLKDLGASFDNNGNVTSAFVAYDTTAKNKVTFGGVGATSAVKLSNVAAGSANTDAVNVKQLKDLGATVDTSGNVTNGFVAYDDASKASVTLKGASGTKITNLIAGALNANSTDAVNGSQLYQTNQNVANVTNNLANLAGNVNNMSDTLNNLNGGGGLKYFHANSALADSQAGGANSVAIGGNAQATTTDSVALGSNARTTAANAVALGSGSLADRANSVSVGAGGAERQIVNVAAGSQNTDAVNLKQLKDLGASFDNNGNVTSAFVAYDTTAKNKVTFGGVGATSTVKLSNVAAGSANTDAVNVKQLKDLGATVDTSGNVTNGFVAYDDASKASVTLKGASGTKITNLIAGALNANSTDAVNGSQLYQTNQNVANIGASVNNVANYYNTLVEGGGIKHFHANSSLDDSLASAQDAIAIGGNAQANDTGTVSIGAGALADRSNSIAIGQNAQASAANSVALGANSSTTATLTTPAYQPGTTQLAGATPVGEVSVGSMGNERRVTNVAAGAADTDAVNVSQLRSAVDASSSGVLAEAVIYDNAQHNSVTLGGTAATSPVALKNVAPGTIASGSRDAINGSQLYNVASTTAAALGGGAAAGSDGKIAAPTYVISGNSYNDVGNALSAIGTVVNAATTNLKYFKVVPPRIADDDAPAVASGEFAMALGAGAAANGNYAMALGSGSSARNDLTVAIGFNAQTSASNSVALGAGSVAKAENIVSVGSTELQRRITNVADGIDSTDAVTMHQFSELQGQMLHATNGPRSMLLGAPNPLDFIAVSPTTTTTNMTLTSNDPNALAIGPGATSIAANTTSVGTLATAGGNKSTAVGAGAGAAREGATAVGQGTAALGINATVIGTGASTGFGAENAVALGYMASAIGAGSMSFGANADANGTGSIAFGNGSMTLTPATNAVALGANSVAARANTISVGSDTLQRQIVNVAAGTSNTDAVNVSQLKGITTVLGGGAGIASDGSVTKPVYTIGGQTYSDVGAALNAAAASGGGASPDAVSYDTAAHSRVTFGGATGAPVTLANVAPGLLAANSTEAINGAQLYNTASTVAGALGSGATVGADGKVKAPTYTIGGSTYNNVGTALSAVDSALATGGNPNGVVYDSSARNKVTLGGAGASTSVTLTNLADAKADSDAVNLKQLKAAGIAVDPSTGRVTNALVAYDGASKSSVTFNAGGSATQLKNVADAVDALDAVNLRQMQSYVSTQITNYTPTPTPLPVANDLPVGTATGTDAIAIGNGANASGSGAIAIGARTATAGDQSVALGVAASAPATNAVALGANSVADRDNSVSMGAVGSERQITNVAAGTAATDAVNLGQMNSAISGVYKSMQDMDRDNKRGIAAASALNIVTPYLPGRTTLNAGVAGYRGTAALGVGVSRWNEKGSVNYNLGVSSAGGNSTIVRAGVGIVFGD